MSTRICAMALLAGALVLSSEKPASAQAIGCMRMPSTIAQYLGYCYGAGHHAPIILAPSLRPERTHRMAYVPAGCQSLAPAACGPTGCIGGTCAPPMAGPWMGTPAPAPAHRPATAPPAPPAAAEPLPHAASQPAMRAMWK